MWKIHVQTENISGVDIGLLQKTNVANTYTSPRKAT